jgi:hypothetical protein
MLQASGTALRLKFQGHVQKWYFVGRQFSATVALVDQRDLVQTGYVLLVGAIVIHLMGKYRSVPLLLVWWCR